MERPCTSVAPSPFAEPDVTRMLSLLVVGWPMLASAALSAQQQTRLHAERVTVKVRDSAFALGYDVLPLPGIRGFPFPRSADVLVGRLVFGGQLGNSSALNPRNAEAKVIVFLPPPRPADGQPDYQVWAHAPLLAQYSRSAAILIVALDLTPPTVVHSVTTWAADPGRPPGIETPPVLLISAAAANAMLGGDVSTMRVGKTAGEMRIHYNVQTRRTRESQEVVALERVMNFSAWSSFGNRLLGAMCAASSTAREARAVPQHRHRRGVGARRALPDPVSGGCAAA